MSIESEACKYCGMSGAHSPECPTQFKTEESKDKDLVGVKVERPTEKDFQDRMEHFTKRMRSESLVRDLYRWAGGDQDQIRKENYPGWTDEDFKKLCGMIKDEQRRESDEEDELEKKRRERGIVG